MDQIWKWITDNWVNALSLTLAVIGVVLAVIFYLRQRNPKSLDYTVRSVVRVIVPPLVISAWWLPIQESISMIPILP